MIFQSLLPPVTKRHTVRKIIDTQAVHLFRIIEDVDRYSQFLPFCSHSKVIRRSTVNRDFEAKLKVGIPPLFEEEYVSRVRVRPDVMTIEAKSIQSKVMESLSSRWTLHELKAMEDKQGRRTNSRLSQCHVDFEVEMTVRDPVIAEILDKMLREVAQQQVAAFEKRCTLLPYEHHAGNDFAEKQ